MRRATVIFSVVAAITSVIVSFASSTSGSFSSGTATSHSLKDQLESLRQQNHLPALAVAIVNSKGVVESAAVGVRKEGTTIAVTTDDLWHLGSCTKAMTATVLGSLVEQGKLRWDSTIGEIFPDHPEFPTEFQKISLQELLSHRAGLPANLDWGSLNKLGVNVISQRRQALIMASKTKLLSTPGTQYFYSNAGYVLAGTIAEKVTGESWEELIKKIVFEPLGMTSAGFGGVGTPGQIDQPWGHDDNGKPVSTNGPAMDNPPVMGPAGRVHATLADWAKFVADQMRGDTGKKPSLLPAEVYHELHRPHYDNQYAFGWFAVQLPPFGTTYNHSGSNTMNFCLAWMMPGRDLAVLVCTNQGGSKAQASCLQIASTLLTQRAMQSLTGAPPIPGMPPIPGLPPIPGMP